MNKLNNPQMKVVRAGLIFSAITLAIAFSPAFIEMDMMDYGFALIVISGFLTLCGVITTIFYYQRAKLYESILRGDDVLAEWTYPRDVWAKYCKDEYEEESTEKRHLLYVVLIIMLIVGIGFVIADPEAGVIVFGILFAVACLLCFVAIWVPKFSYKKKLNSNPTVRVSKSSACIGDVFHSWKSYGAKLEEVELEKEDESTQSYIRIVYSGKSRQGRDYFSFRILIPDGLEPKAGEIVQILKTVE